MKKNKIKGLLMVAMIAVLLTAAIGGTVAWIVDKTNEVENVFTPANLNTEIYEEKTGTTKSVVKVENVNAPENVDAYVRVAVVANWVDDEGNIVGAWTGSIDHDETYWTLAADGFYYYNEILPVGEKTKNLLANPYTYGADDVPVKGAHLEMTIIHQSIQAVGWGTDVTDAQSAFTKAKAN